MSGKASIAVVVLTGALGCGGDQPLVPVDRPGQRGKIFVSNDEWLTTEVGFARAADAAIFVTNLANWFTDAAPGEFLVYSKNFALTGQSFRNALFGAGHSVTVDATGPQTVEAFAAFDAVFLAGTEVDNNVLADYVRAGGNVYLAGGTGTSWFPSGAVEAASWNPFLNQFGLAYAPTWNGLLGNIAISSSHPTLIGVSALYHDRGNSVSVVGSASTLIQSAGAEGLYAVFEP